MVGMAHSGCIFMMLCIETLNVQCLSRALRQSTTTGKCVFTSQSSSLSLLISLEKPVKNGLGLLKTS